MRKWSGLYLFFLIVLGSVWQFDAIAAPLLLAPATNSIADGKSLQNLLDNIEKQRGNIVAIQRELVSRKAVGPEYDGAGEEEKARWVEAWLSQNGINFERLDFPDERVPAKVRPNIVAALPENAAPGQRTLWLLSHFDVAPVGIREFWNSDPFALRVDGDMLYGRGVEDNNQGITVSLMLFDLLRKSKVLPPTRLGMLITSGALNSYEIGIGHVLAKQPDIFGPDDLILVMDYGNAEGSLMSVGEKGNIWIKVTVTGKTGHAGNPGAAVNAFAASAELVHGLRDLQKEFPAEDALFIPPYTTITPTRIENIDGGINHIPGELVFYLDARIMQDYTYAEVEDKIRTLADSIEQNEGVVVKLDIVDSTATSRVTPLDAPIVQALDRAIVKQLGVTPTHVGTGSITMACTIRQKGLPVVVWGVQDTLRNKADEYARVSAHIKQARVIANILFDPMLNLSLPIPGSHPDSAGSSQK